MDKMKSIKKPSISLRMNILFFIVFILFLLLILRLGMIQIVYGEEYKKELARAEDIMVHSSVPRGEIFDRNGKLIVGNKPLNAITYSRPKGIRQRDILDAAFKLSGYIKWNETDLEKVTERDRKDFWMLMHPEKAKRLVTQSEKKKLGNEALYKRQLSRIPKQDLDSLTKKELAALAVFREMTRGSALSPQIIKNHGVTTEEFAVVSEHLPSLPGVNTAADWERYNPFKNKSGDLVLGSVLGGISSSKEGLPKEMEKYYIARDYSRNERVGKSYLESQYEEVLQGKKQKIKNVTDKDGNILSSEVIRQGRRGYDLVLSIDIELQQKVEGILQRTLAKTKPGHRFLDRAFVAMMNPYTGEILTLAGKQYEGEKKRGNGWRDFALGNITTAYSMGSVVKGATVLTGYQTGAIRPGEVIMDQPLKFKGTNLKKSWVAGGMGPINDLTALKRSSNVYMFRTAMNLGGQREYKKEGTLHIHKKDAIAQLRKSFYQFGLGVKTGIDLPGEQAGFGGAVPREPGKVLDFAIGQYDTYTPLQLVQYVSVIANGGYRIQPHIAKEIRYPGEKGKQLGPLVKEITPRILNRVSMESKWINRVKYGFQQVTGAPGGTAYGYFDNSIMAAGKTGTAQGLYDGPEAQRYWKQNMIPPMTWNTTFAGFAPSNHPEIAISVVVPWVYEGKQKDPHISLLIANEALKAYFQLKRERAGTGLDVL